MTRSRRPGLPTLAAVAMLTLAGCALELQNLQPAREIKEAAQPTASVYTGWRVFQDRCAACHGPAATGTAKAPDLLPRVREMGERRFVGLVLDRYDWALPPAPGGRDAAAMDKLVDQILRREAGAVSMPAWQGEPRVTAHIADLYAYLSARAQGTLGTGRPGP